MPWVSRGVIHSFLILSILLGGALRNLADNGWEGQILSITWENDADVRTDRHYTQGAKISYFSSDDALAGWLRSFSDHLPAIGLDVEARKFGLAVGQEIYTPEDLKAVSVITNDRPYAGWLFASCSLQRRGEVSRGWLAAENLSLDIGVVGADSEAEATQDVTHFEKPHGWSHQLKNEPAFDLRYDRRYFYRFREKDERWRTDFIPAFTASAGTVATFLGLGTTVRYGYNIPNEFEAVQQPTPLGYGGYVFTSAEGRYVIRNIFLDGNTFTSSAHIEKEPLVADLRIGFTIVLKSVEVTAAQTVRTREFKGQRANDSYGTAMMTVKF